MGFALAVWSRPLTAAYAPAVLWGAWQRSSTPVRARNLALASALCALTILVPMALNTLKFDHPLESGYRYIYLGRDDGFAKDAAHGIFSTHFIPRNLYYMNAAFPQLVETDLGTRLEPDSKGAGIWLPSPLLLLVFVYGPCIWRDPQSRWMLLGAMVVFAALLLYHGTGEDQGGYNRYSLDYVPVMMGLIAPHVETGRRPWVVLACVAWSVTYFCFLIAA